MNNVKFDNFELLYVFIPLALIVLIPFFIALKKQSFKFKNLFSSFLHLIICALLSLSLSGIKTEEITTDSTTYILADVSYTTTDVLDQMDEYIKEFNEKKSISTELGIVAFGKDSVELTKPGENIKSLSEADIDDSATNIQQAIEYTISLFEENSKKRIVLLSDGKQTDGDVLSLKEQIAAENIRIDAVYFNSSLDEETLEVQVDSIKAKASTFKDAEDFLKVSILSSLDNVSQVIIYDNEKEIYNETLSLTKGENVLEVRTNTNETGKHNYKCEIINENDITVDNNVDYFRQEIHEKCEVLVISSAYSDAKYIESLISEKANVTRILTYDKIPTSIDSYMKFDEIFLSNVNLNYIENNENFVNILETLVSKYGKSLVTFGGNDTYFDGGFGSSKLKEMIPVDLNPADTKRKTALIMVIDNSGSMEGTSLEMAKEGAIQCLEVLEEHDYVGVITFEDTTKVIQPLISVKFKDTIAKKIRSIRAGNGTMMTPGLQEAYEEMKRMQTQMSNREVMLISDGSPGDAGQPEVVQKMAEEGIVVSTINIGGQYAGDLLKQLSEIGNGRYYSIKRSDNLPEIMFEEVKEIVMDSIIDDVTPIKILSNNDAVLDGIDNLPNIMGYNYSKAKYNATTVLATELLLETGEKVDEVPIYSYWTYGQGKVASFMSDVSTSSWSKTLFDSAVGKKLMNSILTTNYPNERNNSSIIMDVINHGYTSTMEISVARVIPNTQMKATITTPNQEEIVVNVPLGGTKYVTTIETMQQGVYDVRIDYINPTNLSVITVNDSFTYSYSKEYDMFDAADNIILWQLTESSGMVSDIVDEIVNIEQEDLVYSVYFNKELLITALILFVIDVIIRKLRWKDIRNLFRKNSI